MFISCIRKEFKLDGSSLKALNISEKKIEERLSKEDYKKFKRYYEVVLLNNVNLPLDDNPKEMIKADQAVLKNVDGKTVSQVLQEGKILLQEMHKRATIPIYSLGDCILTKFDNSRLMVRKIITINKESKTYTTNVHTKGRWLNISNEINFLDAHEIRLYKKSECPRIKD